MFALEGENPAQLQPRPLRIGFLGKQCAECTYGTARIAAALPDSGEPKTRLGADLEVGIGAKQLEQGFGAGEVAFGGQRFGGVEQVRGARLNAARITGAGICGSCRPLALRSHGRREQSARKQDLHSDSAWRALTRVGLLL